MKMEQYRERKKSGRHNKLEAKESVQSKIEKGNLGTPQILLRNTQSHGWWPA